MATPHDSPSDHRLPSHSPEEPLSNSSGAKFGEGKGTWVLCMNKVQNSLSLNHIHQFRAWMPLDWMWHIHKTSGLFTLQGGVNGNGRQNGAAGRALGKEAVRRHRAWTQPIRVPLFPAFPVSPIRLCTPLEGGLVYRFVL